MDGEGFPISMMILSVEFETHELQLRPAVCVSLSFIVLVHGGTAAVAVFLVN